jgi:V/A-type H+-transporting ATPase subunit I
MAVAQMQKVLIASHRSEAKQLLNELQSLGIIEILNAERAMVSKEWPELQTEAKRPRELEDLVSRIGRSITFLNKYAIAKKGIMGALAPLEEIDVDHYQRIVASDEAMQLLEKAEALAVKIDELNSEMENYQGHLQMLAPWKQLEIPVEQLADFDKAATIVGLLPEKHLKDIEEQLTELGAAIETVGSISQLCACVIVCLKESLSNVQKTLRAADFSTVSFEGFEGTAAQLIDEQNKKLTDLEKALAEEEKNAADLAEQQMKIAILYDYYQNLTTREQARVTAPATDHTVLLEGWVKIRDCKKLEKTISDFGATSVTMMDPAEDEEIPIEIDNKEYIKPFETITRLHGMPTLADVDPTAFLAPFFTLFFGLCLTDAGYGIVMVALLWWVLKKLQGDKKALWMFFICSISTIVAGALTGGWFGDTFQTLIPQDTAVFTALNGFRNKLMLFDPMKDPMTFFMLSLALGYLQIMFALFIGFFNNLSRKDYATAVFNFLAWIIFLNSLAVVGLSKAIEIPQVFGSVAKWVAISQAILIFCFTERKSGMAGRIGGGVFALFSTVFYFGDILSYVRIMALGMVTAGLGIAVNILVLLVMDVPYIGFILGAVFFVGGHTVNLALSVLSSFVHSLRLQFVEFFPKFFTGGGKEFKPLTLSFKHLMIKTKQDSAVE